ncbi:MAG: DUF4365 domain-containing protein [Pirellulaceae bacterium]
MAGDSGKRRRKRRTRGHVIADLSVNHLEYKVLLCGHILRRPEQDYGVDAVMFHFDAKGRIENGEVRFQLKATDNLNTIQGGRIVACTIDLGDLDYWSGELGYPFILVVFDARQTRAYWLNVQDYMTQNSEKIDFDNQRVNVHIPASNELTVETIDLFRSQSLAVIKRLSS